MTDAIYTDPFHPHLILHRVEGGNFMMGGSDENAEENEFPLHRVSVPTFYLGKYPVTQLLWEILMYNNLSRNLGANLPVENVSWIQVVNDFLPKLNKATGNNYRLPTEAEWEFACKGGIKSVGYQFSGSDKLKQSGWYEANSENKTHPVGLKKGNELGLYDMSGNVWEWCSDYYYYNYNGAPIDGSARPNNYKNANMVLRGGGYFSSALKCRVSSRNNDPEGAMFDNIGFRLALSPR